MERSGRSVKEWMKDMFSLQMGERRGGIILLLLLAGIAFWAMHEQWFPKVESADMQPMKEEMDRWLAGRQQDTSGAAASQGSIASLAEPFPFDPNTVSREQWRALGLSDKQVDGIERYQRKGGRFRTKKDLGRMYSLRPEQFERLRPYILLPDSTIPAGEQQHTREVAHAAPGERRERWEPSATPRYERPEFRKVEVNTADTTMLVALPGIGPAFARGIVKYRDGLGGYHSLDQLAEVYVLQDKPDAVTRLKQLLVLDTLMVRRIPINSCTVEQLAAHPYARWKVAKPLIAFRAQHGPFRTVEEIKGCALVSEEVFRKLAPYLSLE